MNQPQWACPICQAEAAEPPARCPACRAVVAWSDLNALLSNTEAIHASQRLPGISNRRAAACCTTIWPWPTESAADHAGLEQLRLASALQPENRLVRALVAALAQRPAAPPTTKMTILVVDDSATQRHFAAQVLGDHGFRVVTASNGQEALQKLANLDLIFLDINMPGMDGYEVCKSIKENPATASIPIIMLSGKDGFFDKMRGRMVGATDHVTKPCEPSVLLATIEKYVSAAASASVCTRE